MGYTEDSLIDAIREKDREIAQLKDRVESPSNSQDDILSDLGVRYKFSANGYSSYIIELNNSAYEPQVSILHCKCLNGSCPITYAGLEDSSGGEDGYERYPHRHILGKIYTMVLMESSVLNDLGRSPSGELRHL